MESLARLVTDSLARHGFDHPMDPRRLQWSRWFRCDSPHSLLVVPSKPGIFAIAEEIMDLGPGKTLGSGDTPVETAALGCPERSSATGSSASTAWGNTDRGGRDFSSEPALSKRSEPKGATKAAQSSPASAAEVLGGAALERCDSSPAKSAALAAEAKPSKRLLAVLQFSEDDDMAFTLDRMFTRMNPMRSRLATGKCFLRFVVIEQQDQRRNICAALNQWMLSSAEKVTGIPAAFSSSLEIASVGRTLMSDSPDGIPIVGPQPILKKDSAQTAPYLDSGASRNLHCPHPLPSGF